MIEILYPDTKRNTYLLIATCNGKTDFLNAMQYLIDGMEEKHSKYLLARNGNIRYDAYKYVTEKYGMRKRNFSERLHNVRTYK